MKNFLLVLLAVVAGCNFSTDSKKERQVEQLIVSLQTADSLNDLPATIRIGSDVLALDAKNCAALTYRGRAYMLSRDTAQGLRDINQAIQICGNAASYYSRAMAYSTIGNKQAAFTDLLQAIEINKDFAPAYYMMGILKIEEGDANQAIELCHKGDSAGYNFEASHQLRATIFRISGKYPQALEEFNQLVQRSKTETANYNNRGMVLTAMGQPEAAVADFNMAIRLDPAGAFPYNNKAEAQLKLGQYDSALASVNKSLELNDQNGYAYKNRGLIMKALQKKEQACADFAKASALPMDLALEKELRAAMKGYCQFP